ncbi:MAG: DUF6607 family protein [Pseudomonadota bacterium]
MKTNPLALLTLLVAALLAGPAAAAEAQDTPRQYTFAWKFAAQDQMQPRGGTSRGAPITLQTEPAAAWQALQAPGLSKKERDRRAILAMAGPYRASFDFIETMGFAPDYEPKAPYQSWGTEYVYVVADEPEFVSLQHVLVMFIVMEDGAMSDPIVVKHWRQDWRYEDRDLYAFTGHRTWSHQRLSRRTAKGTWSQAVYQVDDSPRYQSYGTWEHHPGYSTWRSAETWRPLPRREFSIRNDYHVLVGYNQHTITPSGWVHTEDNKKVALTADGAWVDDLPIVAIEAGLNRYERISDHDWSAGDAYWEKTGAFWALVRDAWTRAMRAEAGIELHEQVDGQSLFMQMFGLARQHSEDFDESQANAAIEATIQRFRVQS